MLALAGDVTGRRILDAGAGMLTLARRGLGDDVDLHVVDLCEITSGAGVGPAAGSQ